MKICLDYFCWRLYHIIQQIYLNETYFNLPFLTMLSCFLTTRYNTWLWKVRNLNLYLNSRSKLKRNIVKNTHVQKIIIKNNKKWCFNIIQIRGYWNQGIFYFQRCKIYYFYWLVPPLLDICYKDFKCCSSRMPFLSVCHSWLSVFILQPNFHN